MAVEHGSRTLVGFAIFLIFFHGLTHHHGRGAVFTRIASDIPAAARRRDASELSTAPSPAMGRFSG